MDKLTDIEIKIMDYHNKNCKDKGLIFIKSEKRIDAESKINFYDFTFQFKEIEMEVTFSDDDADDDIRWRIKLLLRENNIYL
ncbi:MAG: hypothetical protein IPM96_08450 [Ignavibacteria bacterium]|nr:hypothetical protein [Ignavibacteria bacterium]